MVNLKRWWCGLMGHNWTSAADQCMSLTTKQINNGVAGFEEYATMYCGGCGYVYVYQTIVK